MMAVLLLTVVLTTDKLELHRMMHGVHTGWLDAFFSVITHVADGWVPTAISLCVLVFGTYRSFLMMGGACAFSALVVQALKRLFTMDRPFMFKEQLGDMHWVEGVELHHHLSFPSGHAAAAFSMCFAAAVLIRRKEWGWLLCAFACLLAFSRVYLSQHFMEDILAGSAIGTLVSMAVYKWLYESRFAQRPWLRARLVRQRNQ